MSRQRAKKTFHIILALTAIGVMTWMGFQLWMAIDAALAN